LKKTGGEPEGATNEEQQQKEPEKPSEPENPQAVNRLTEENLKKSEQEQKKTKASKPASKAAKPAWALTEKDVEEQKEKEIDDLLEFAYELDYEKYMDDFEVR
jgi:hypothetical protein